MLLFGYSQKPRHQGDRALPVVRLAGDLLAAGFGQIVELGAAILIGGAPAGGDPATLFQAQQGG